MHQTFTWIDSSFTDTLNRHIVIAQVYSNVQHFLKHHPNQGHPKRLSGHLKGNCVQCGSGLEWFFSEFWGFHRLTLAVCQTVLRQNTGPPPILHCAHQHMCQKKKIYEKNPCKMLSIYPNIKICPRNCIFYFTLYQIYMYFCSCPVLVFIPWTFVREVWLMWCCFIFEWLNVTFEIREVASRGAEESPRCYEAHVPLIPL